MVPPAQTKPVLSTGPMINDATRGASSAGGITNPGQRYWACAGHLARAGHTPSLEAVAAAVSSIILPG